MRGPMGTQFIFHAALLCLSNHVARLAFSRRDRPEGCRLPHTFLLTRHSPPWTGLKCHSV